MENVRIDKGVKRGKRRTATTNANPRADSGQFLPILPKDPELIRGVLTDYVNGATFEELGKRYGVSRQAVYAWTLGKLAPAELDDLVTRALTARIAKGDELLDDSSSAPLDVTRGREIARFSRMDYERLKPEKYGQQNHLVIEHVGDLGDRLRRARERVIEGEVVANTPNAALLQPTPNTETIDNS